MNTAARQLKGWIMTKKPNNGDRNSCASSDEADIKPVPSSDAADHTDTYRVGPGRPPREHQFKPGQSGNPKGRPRKEPLGSELKLSLERAMRKKAKVTEGERERITTWATAGVERLVHQFAKGDRHARRELFWLADLIGVDMRADAHRTNRAQRDSGQALLDRYVERRTADKVVRAEHPVLAPPELLDDDAEAADDNHS